MTSKKQDLGALFQKQGHSFGLDEEASSTLIANLGTTVTPMCLGTPFDDDEQETDDWRLIFFGLDNSDSMEAVHDALKESFNDMIIPGLLGGAIDQVGSIRFNGLAFGSQVKPMWRKSGEWQRLQKGNPPVLTDKEYPQNGGGTMLNQAVLDGVTALTSYATQISQRTGSLPECVLVFLSDGANNGPPMDAAEIKKVLDKLSPELFTLVFIGFETYESSYVNFEDIAKSLGFRDVTSSKMKPGETKAEMQKRLRNLMGVFSQQLVSRTSTSQVGKGSSSKTGSKTTPASSNGSTGSGFWDQ